MWICHNCLRRSFLTLLHNSHRNLQVYHHQALRQPSKSSTGRLKTKPSWHQRRQYAALAAASVAQKEAADGNQQLASPTSMKFAQQYKAYALATASVAQEEPARSNQQLASPTPMKYAQRYNAYGSETFRQGKIMKKKKKAKPMDTHTELKRLHDPFRLAIRVRDLLDDGEFDAAAELVRAASKSMDCTVSWNHLISYLMAVQKSNVAMKFYNDMKKRAQTPDAYTYALIFRGLADSHDSKSAVAKALSLLNSMQTPKSPVKPSVTHINSVLKCCARAGDMDSLFALAAKLPENGMGAADAVTWTTILNALRHEVHSVSGPLLSPERVFELKEKAVIQGRRMWADIVEKWKQGRIQVDEQLVGAMGQLLLSGGQERDADDVLSLVSQTMNVPRMAPRLGKVDETVPLGKRLGSGQTENDSFVLSPTMTSEEKSAFEKSVFDDGLVTPPPSFKNRNMSTVAYTRAANTTLTMLLAACEKLRNKKAAKQYWEYLTQKQGVRPDAVAYHAYLRVLRLMRAGAEAVEKVREMTETPGIRLELKTFRIAISACRRNINNAETNHAGQFKHADELVELIRTHSDVGWDPMSLVSYLEIAQSTRNRGMILKALTTINELRDRYFEEDLLLKPKREPVKDKADEQTKRLLAVKELAMFMEGSLVRFLNRSGEDRIREQEYRSEIGKWSDLREKMVSATRPVERKLSLWNKSRRAMRQKEDRKVYRRAQEKMKKVNLKGKVNRMRQGWE